MRILFCCIVLCLGNLLYGQEVTNGLVAHYSFDACDNLGKDESGNNTAAVIQGTPECVCGVSGNALELDGVGDYILFLGTISNAFTTIDFTVSLYIKPTNGGGIQNVVAKSDACGVDRNFAINYRPGANSIRAELSQNAERSTTLNARLDFEKCWYHVVFVRRGNRSLLFIDGELVQEAIADSRIQIDNSATLNIANGECARGPNSTQNRFAGLVDEVRVYDRALRLDEINALYLEPDRIQNDDAILFLGNTVDINVGETCADIFSWAPLDGISDPAIAAPSITPTTAGVFTYELSLADQFCTASDTIQITVIDPEELPCVAQLPKAFTPNGDGRNDDYGISNSVVLDGKLIEFEIFDRWGGRIFRTNSPFEKWNGTFEGKELNPGVLLYRVRYMCGEEEKTDMGSLTLLR